MAEASGVSDIGRISPGDTGLYLDSHVDAWRPIVQFIKEHGAVAGIQLAHAGRKASTDALGAVASRFPLHEGAWTTVSASPLPFDAGYPAPKELSVAELDQIVEQFEDAAHRALAAGFQVGEIHAAHGYLLHSISFAALAITAPIPMVAASKIAFAFCFA